MSCVAGLPQIDRQERIEMASNNSRSIFRIVGLILTPILRAVTPEIEKELESFLIKFYGKAMATENPLDDLLARFLLNIFDIPVPTGG